eukprot:TRINITY_DN12184_c0_g1_i1.p1 TRINITY_DN12184_c0_g1~~TRINITY_DN12184_c0_g1_i1.p1  ORF type:complete len:512 (-),score=129.55 TRINITY_DN12184_c0_g1_i1:841-2376(-)
MTPVSRQIPGRIHLIDGPMLAHSIACVKLVHLFCSSPSSSSHLFNHCLSLLSSAYILLICMDTKPKEGAHGKERKSPSPSAALNVDSSHGRRTPKSAVAGSPGRENSPLSEKSTPNYLKPTARPTNEANKPKARSTNESNKPTARSTNESSKPTASSTHESNRTTKKPAPNALPTKPLTRKMSLDKYTSPSQTQRTPSSPSPTQRMPISSSSKEKSLKPSASFPRTGTSPKPILEKSAKTVGNGKNQPPVKTKSLKKEPSMKKSEIKASPATKSTATSSHDIAEKSAKMPDEQEDKGVHEIALETLKVEGEEQTANDIQAIDPVDTEPDTYENDKLEASNTSYPLEEQKDATAVEEEDKKSYVCETNEEAREQGEKDEGQENGKSSEQLEENLTTDNHKQIERKKEEDHDDDRKMRTCAGDESEKESEITENDRTELKKINVSSTEDTKLESDKEESKRQDIRGKKESPAYNDVIEETASKLVEKRKNKVRALVGAFETVISLQEPEGQGG